MHACSVVCVQEVREREEREKEEAREGACDGVEENTVLEVGRKGAGQCSTSFVKVPASPELFSLSSSPTCLVS